MKRSRAVGIPKYQERCMTPNSLEDINVWNLRKTETFFLNILILLFRHDGFQWDGNAVRLFVCLLSTPMVWSWPTDFLEKSPLEKSPLYRAIWRQGWNFSRKSVDWQGNRKSNPPFQGWCSEKVVKFVEYALPKVEDADSKYKEKWLPGN